MAERCNAVLGHLKDRGQCSNRAVWQRQSIGGTWLCYCEKHKERAFNPSPMNYVPMPGSQAERIKDFKP